jgi:hypothetical protein
MSESAMDLESLSPEDALRKLIRHTFDYHSMHPDFVRLVMNENIHQGAHIGSIGSIKTRNRHVLTTLRGLLDRGVAAGAFRADIDPIELHMSISALSFYNVSNRYTFSRIFETDMSSPEAVASRREVVVDIIMRWCATPGTRGSAFQIIAVARLRGEPNRAFDAVAAIIAALDELEEEPLRERARKQLEVFAVRVSVVKDVELRQLPSNPPSKPNRASRSS